MAHAPLPPSDAERWLVCAGSRAMAERYPDTAGPDAIRGTMLHERMLGLVSGKASWADNRDLDAADIDALHTAYRSLMQLLDDYGSRGRDVVLLGLETRVKTSVNADCWGTADGIWLVPARRLLIIHDYKFGYHPVNPASWPQGLLYADGARQTFARAADVDTVLLAVNQPAQGDSCVTHLIDRWELDHFVAEARQPAAAAMAVLQRGATDADLTPGAHCEWCKARGSCPALRRSLRDLLPDPDMPTAGPADPAAMEAAALADILKDMPLIMDWLGAVERRALALMLSGHELPGFKLVEHRGKRSIVDHERLIATLTLAGMVPERIAERRVTLPLDSIDKLLKTVDWTLHADIKACLGRPPARLVMAPETDRRAAKTPPKLSATLPPVPEED